MRRIVRSVVAAIIAVCVMCALPVSADPAYDTYTYSYQGQASLSPDAYLPEVTVSLENTTAGALSSPQDIVSDKAGNLYIADSGNKRVVVLNADYTVQRVIDSYNVDGKAQPFVYPCGLFRDSEGGLYVADRDAGQVVLLDTQYHTVQVFSTPDSPLIPESFAFMPIALSVDTVGRMYIVCKNNSNGILTLTASGEFDGFIGAQKVTYSLQEVFWRLFMTEAQKQATTKFIPTEYSNICIDDEGFLFVTSSSVDSYSLYASIVSRSRASDYAPIKKLNSAGTDVLNRNGFFPPAGDVDIVFGYGNDYGPSLISDVALGPEETFTLLDTKRNKLFTYDSDGKLLFAFSGKGAAQGLFTQPTSLCYAGDRLLCVDAGTNCVTVFAQTDYGRRMQMAVHLYNTKQYAEAADAWAALAAENNNLEIAYENLGKVALREQRYEDSIDYYKIANNTTGVSKAFSKLRNAFIQKWMLLVAVIAVAVFAGIVWVLKRIGRVNERADLQPEPHRLIEKLCFGFRMCHRPFDGAWDLKHQQRGDIKTATVYLAVAAVVYTLNQYGSGYIFSFAASQNLNVLASLATVVLPVLLWTVANWGLSTLMDGEGNLKQVYVAACYSLLPMILLFTAVTALSHVMLIEETQMRQFLLNIGLYWTLALVFFSSMTIHRYTFIRNACMTVLSVIGMMAVAFVMVLFGTLIGQMVSFAETLFREVTFRL